MSRDWAQIVTKGHVSIAEVIKLIDEHAMRIALVVDDVGKLLGTVTDGDVRRGLLEGCSLDDSVSRVMNSEPFCVGEGERSGLRNLMHQRDLVGVPILDENGIVVDFESARGGEVGPRSNSVFLMAGGFGKRLKPLTDHCPKPMLEIAGKPILEHIMNQYIESGFVRFYFSLHYLPERIEEYFGDGSDFGVSIEYVREEVPLGTAGALGLLPPDAAAETLLMGNGDVVSSLEPSALLDFHMQSKADLTVCSRRYEHTVPFGVIDEHGGLVKGIIEKPVRTEHVNAGIYAINSTVVKLVKNGEHLDMPDLIQQCVAIGLKVSLFPIHEYWQDVGRPADLNLTRSQFQ